MIVASISLSPANRPLGENMSQHFIGVVVRGPQCGQAFLILDRRSALCLRKLGQRRRGPD